MNNNKNSNGKTTVQYQQYNINSTLGAYSRSALYHSVYREYNRTTVACTAQQQNPIKHF